MNIMNLLTDSLPHLVNIAGIKFPINWDFRASVKFEMLIENPEIDEKNKLLQSLLIYYPIASLTKKEIEQDADSRNLFEFFESHMEEAYKSIIDFYAGKDEKADIKSQAKSKEGIRTYSFKYDDALIFASFWQQYGINLSKEKIHWWLFRTLLLNLQDSTPMGRVMMYRCMNTSKMPKEQRQEYESLKRKFALPEIVSKSEKEFQQKEEDIWEHGGDLASIRK